MEVFISPLDVILWSLTGAALGLVFSWMPGFHIYNLLALVVLLAPGFIMLNPYAIPYFALGAVIAFSFASSIASTYLSVADESLMLMLFPSQRYLMLGKGHRVVLLYLIGALGGALFLSLFSLTIGIYVMPVIYNLFSPYYTWVLVAVVLFLFLSEWPKEGDREETGISRLLAAWRQILGGVFVFFASGILGFIATYTGLLPVEAAYARLTPLFIGFFGMSWVIRNLLSRRTLPRQDTRDAVETHPTAVMNGIASGVIGGGIAAFFPVITGGMGALIGGHMASGKGDDTFVVSQGAARTVYYVGALFLLFMPTARITRGAVAWLIGGVYTPKTWLEFYYAGLVIILVAAISFITTLYISKAISRLLSVISYVHISLVVAVFLVLLTYLITGPLGILLLAVATALGFTAQVLNTRISYCLGALILPVLLNMTGTSGILLSLLGIG